MSRFGFLMAVTGATKVVRLMTYGSSLVNGLNAILPGGQPLCG